MASLVLNGNTSGSVTISSPAVSGTTTLTLPTTSGTVALTASPTFTGQATIPTINLTGGQITFPATQSASADANTLDDYEEGTWTPDVGGTATYAGRGGSYVKIGQFVYAYFYITINVIGTGSTTTVTGLPFTLANDGYAYSGGSVSYFNALNASITWLGIQPQNNTTTFAFVGCVAAQAGISNILSVFKNGTVIYGCITYKSAA